MVKAPQNWGTNSRDAIPLSAAFSVVGGCVITAMTSSSPHFDAHPCLALSLGPLVTTLALRSEPPAGVRSVIGSAVMSEPCRETHEAGPGRDHHRASRRPLVSVSCAGWVSVAADASVAADP